MYTDILCMGMMSEMKLAAFILKQHEIRALNYCTYMNGCMDRTVQQMCSTHNFNTIS